MSTLFLILLIGCGGEPKPVDPPHPEPDVQADVDFNDAMKEHYAIATDARNALIKGDLAGARDAAARMEGLADPEVPEPWKPYLEKIKAGAKELADAEDEDAAGQKLGALAKACSDCHADVGGGPKAAAKEARADKEPPEGHMKQHLWVADRMWLGLIAADLELFQESGRYLGELEYHYMAAEDAEDQEAATLEKQVHELASSQSEMDDRDGQAVLYGHMVTNCAKCHARVGVKPTVE